MKAMSRSAPDVRPVARWALPHFIGVGLGKGEPVFMGAVLTRLEPFKWIDQPAESVGRNLRADEPSLLHAPAIKQGARGRFTVAFGPDLAEGFQKVFRHHLGEFALVGTRLVFPDGDALLLMAA